MLVKRSDEIVGTEANKTGERVDRDVLFGVGVEPILGPANSGVFAAGVAKGVPSGYEVMGDQPGDNR